MQQRFSVIQDNHSLSLIRTKKRNFFFLGVKMENLFNILNHSTSSKSIRHMQLVSVYKRIHKALSRSAFLHKVIKMNIVHIFTVDCLAPFLFLLACPPLPLPHGKYDVDGPSRLLPGASSNHKLKGRRPKPYLQEKLGILRLFGFPILVTQFSVFITHNSKIVGPLTQYPFGKR